MSLGLFQFQFPIYQPTIHIIPVFPRKRIVDLDIDAIEILLVTARRFFRNNLFPIEIFFDGKQDLIGIDRLYQIIGDFIADRLIHNIFFLTLGYHDDRSLRSKFLDTAQRFEAAQSRHIFIEDYQIEMPGLDLIESIAAIGHGNDLIPFLAKKQDMRFQQIDFIIGPKNDFTLHIATTGYLRQI